MVMKMDKIYITSLKAKDIMTGKVITIEEERSVFDAIEKMMKNDIECLPVVKDRTLKGIITFRDIITKVVYNLKDPKTTKVKDIMSKNVITCSPDSTLLEVVKLMKNKRLRRIPVIDENSKLVGIISDFDLAIFGWDLK